MTLKYPDIVELATIVESLPLVEKALFQRLYDINTVVGEQSLPPGMEFWVKQQFGSVEAVCCQKIVKVTNMVTYEGTVFNSLRGIRPVPALSGQNLDVQLEQLSKTDPFREPLANTPEEPFGRVVGKHCITAGNIAKLDGLHGLVIFNEFHPLRFTREQVVDYFAVAREWAAKAHAYQPDAKYFLLLWNCLWRAAATVNHGHMQTVLTSGRHYSRIDWLRRTALDYQQDYGSSYFDDLFQAHRSVGCAVEKDGVRVLAHLTPFRDNETVIIGSDFSRSFAERIYDVMACLRDRVGVTSFNFTLVTPPLAETGESWAGFPVLARVIDRGNLNERSSDLGGFSIYASSFASRSPFELAGHLKQSLG